MRPHRLHVTAFGAFAGTETVTFDDLEGLFLLHGETGAGKTTLLDAIAFALYGKVPGERGSAKRLRSDHAAPGVATEVELEATIGARRLRITRRPEQTRPKKSGTGTTTEPPSVRLDELTSGGAWANKSTRVAEADAEILSLMGMSADQFFQVVLLPQGQFAKFLHAEAKDKEALLQKLFSTDRFRKVEDWLADRRRATEKGVQAASETVDRLLAQVAQAAGVPHPDAEPDPRAWSASLASSAAAARDAAAAGVEARRRDLDAALAAKTGAEQLADRQRRRHDTLSRQRQLAAAAPAIAALRAESEAAARAAEVIPVLAAADRARAAADDARTAEARDRAAIPADALRTADPGALAAAGREQQVKLGRLEELRAVAQDAAAEDQNAATARERAARLDDDRGPAAADAERRSASRLTAAQARDAASQATAAQLAVQAAADAARRIATDAAALVTERATWERLRAVHLDARETRADLRDQADKLREARIDGMRAELAATMTDGSPCPVCGSLDHPDPVEPTFEPVSQEQEAAAIAHADQASAAADKAGQDVAAAEARIGELAERLTGAGFPAATQTDQATLAAAARQAELDARQSEAEAARLTAQAASLDTAQRTLDGIDKAIAADESTLAEITERHTAAIAEAGAAERRAADHRAKLRAQLGDATDLDAALSATRQLAEALTTAAEAAGKAVDVAAEAAAAQQRAVQAALSAGFADIGAVRAAARDPRWRGDCDERISRHEAETEAVATLLADPDLADVSLDPPAPVAEMTAAAADAQRAHAAAVEDHGRISHTASQLADLHPRLVAALAELKPKQDLADQVKHLADLAAGVGTANQYRMTLSSFVLAARLEEVAQAASERLLTMTGGRYSLIHSDAKQGNKKAGLSLLAQDSWTGQDRDTATLSGGETFLASLALALGLADVVTAESAGSPMEALFVDEGFGTLDEDTLDEVMAVLDTLRAGGRIVGIVSHVTELRQRIPAQIHVRKSRHGSHVEVIAG